MANNSTGNSHKQPVTVVHNRTKHSRAGEQTDSHMYNGMPLFSHRTNYTSAPWPENMRNVHAMQQMQMSDPHQLMPVVGFVQHFPPPGFHNHRPAEMMNHPYATHAYQNPNVFNHVVINNTSHAVINPFPPGNAFGGVTPTSNSQSSASGDISQPCTRNTPNCALNGPITDHFDEMIKTALDGCKKAVNLAGSNQKRPCFKKIDTLCANLQLDLVKPDNVMANVNSQGLAWAVKDFIFVFTRIMNAWIIIKGYVYKQPAGLVDIQNELCPKFLDAFGRWHQATHELTESLIESFMRLDKLAKSQRVGVNVHAKVKQTEMEKAHEDDKKNEPTECCGFPKTDGSYIRTGLYETVKTATASTRTSVLGGHKLSFPLRDPETDEPYVMVSPKCSTATDDPEPQLPAGNNSDQITENGERRSDGSILDHSLIVKLHGAATASAVEDVLKQVFEIEEAPYFFIFNFTKNYFPDFQLVARKCPDLRTIVTNAEMGAYGKVADLADDLQQLVDACKRYTETFEMFELAKQDEKGEQMRSDIQQQEIANISTMRWFLAKMEPILRDVLCDAEPSGAESRTSSESTLVDDAEMQLHL